MEVARYLVTGGCGFIGSHLVDSLERAGDQIRVLDDLSTGHRENISSAVELVVGDASDPQLIRDCMEGIDGCFHLAAVASVQKSVERWVDCHRTNQTSTVAVLEAARGDGRDMKPVVFASSAAIYGASTHLPLSEDERPAPLSAYGADKLGCELHGAVAGRLFGMTVTALRFFNVYGPRQDSSSPYSGVISIFANRIARGETITVFGDGLQRRDFVYVGDVVRALRASMARKTRGFQVFNVCSGHATTLLELAATLMRVADRDVQIQHGESRPGDIRLSLGDPSRLAAAFGILAQESLETGLQLTLKEQGHRQALSSDGPLTIS